MKLVTYFCVEWTVKYISICRLCSAKHCIQGRGKASMDGKANPLYTCSKESSSCEHLARSQREGRSCLLAKISAHTTASYISKGKFWCGINNRIPIRERFTKKDI